MNYFLAYVRTGGRAIVAVEDRLPMETHVEVCRVEPIEDNHYVAEYGDVYTAAGVYVGLLPENHPARDRLPKKQYWRL